jgi:hypothetical protein
MHCTRRACMMKAQNTRFLVRYVPSIICFPPRWHFLGNFVEKPQFRSQFASERSNGRKWSNIACYTCCEIAISLVFSKKIPNGLHRWIWNWKRTIPGVKNCWISRDTFLGDSKIRHFCDHLRLQNSMETLLYILEFDWIFYWFLRRRWFLKFSVLEVLYGLKNEKVTMFFRQALSVT